MIISRRNPFTGTIHHIEMNVTPGQLEAWESGTVAQQAFSNLSADDREFIMTGILPAQWEEMFDE